MPRSSAPAGAIVNILLIPLGAVCVAAGVVVGSRFAEVRWLGVLLSVLGFVVVIGAVLGLFAWGRAVRVDEATEQAMRQAVAGDGASPDPARVLAHWTFGADEWQACAVSELRFRTLEALRMGVLTTVVGALVIGVLERDWKMGLIVAGVVGAFIALWRWAMAFAAYRRNRAAPAGDVIIGPGAVLVNRRYDTIHDGNVRFRGARVVASGPATTVLEIQIWVPGKYRHTAEEYRLPVPRGREEEARAVARELTAAHTRAVGPGGR